jgi:adenylate cyclase
VERALALNPNLAEAHAVRGSILAERGMHGEAEVDILAGLGLDPESYEVNRAAGFFWFQRRRWVDASRCFEKALALVPTSHSASVYLISCYTAIGDALRLRRAAEQLLSRTEAALQNDPNSVRMLEDSALALAALGESGRAQERMAHALLLNTESNTMRYNFACLLSVHLREYEAALDMLAPVFDRVSARFVEYAKADPELEALRIHPRFQAMLASAEARFSSSER